MMDNRADEQQIDDSGLADAASEASRRAQIEQQLKQVFRLAGDNKSASQLMRMLIAYRCRQQS